MHKQRCILLDSYYCLPIEFDSEPLRPGPSLFIAEMLTIILPSLELGQSEPGTSKVYSQMISLQSVSTGIVTLTPGE